MATQIKSLTPKSRQSKIDAKNHVAKQPPELSPKGKRRKTAIALREAAQAERATHKKSAIKALKAKTNPATPRESKTSFAASLFAGMTPRQVKRLKAVPQRMAQFLESKKSPDVKSERSTVETVE